MAAPIRNNYRPQSFDQNVNFRPRYDASVGRNPRPDFQNFRPRYQERFGDPRHSFETPRWQGNVLQNQQNNFQQHPPFRPFGQGLFSPSMQNNNNVYEQGQSSYSQNTGQQENTSLPMFLGNTDQYQNVNQNIQMNSNINFQQTMPQNNSVQNFQNTGQPLLPPNFGSSSAPFHEQKTDVDDASVGKQYLDAWLRKRQRRNEDIEDTYTHPAQVSSSIHSLQSKMRRMMLLMAQLQQETSVLSDLGTQASDEVWDEQKQKTEALKKELENIHKELSEESTVDTVKQKVLKQRKKRERLKRRRQEIYEEKQRAEEQRNKLHAEIDAWQGEIRKKENEKREARELKKSADAILNEVRKKINDVTKTMDLLKGIQKLRKLRSDRLKQQGVHTNPASDEKFKEVMDEQFETVKKQKDIYLAEERALRVMLETEHEESKEKEREQQEKLNKLKKERENKRTEEILFGKSESFSGEDPMLPFHQYYDQANYNYDSFIQIRCDWDRFVVPDSAPGGTRIPTHFVTPAEPSSDQWASALKDS
uniref:Programmed cell death protein 7 n=1 Tax=Magallana gigas TaxID=29159 RepID=A0A8W8HQW8_MAGGI